MVLQDTLAGTIATDGAITLTAGGAGTVVTTGQFVKRIDNINNQMTK